MPQARWNAMQDRHMTFERLCERLALFENVRGNVREIHEGNNVLHSKCGIARKVCLCVTCPGRARVGRRRIVMSTRCESQNSDNEEQL